MILDSKGRPVPIIEKETYCPRCGSNKDKWAPSGSFGTPHYVCTQCGHEFKEMLCPKLTL